MGRSSRKDFSTQTDGEPIVKIDMRRYSKIIQHEAAAELHRQMAGFLDDMDAMMARTDRNEERVRNIEHRKAEEIMQAQAEAARLRSKLRKAVEICDTLHHQCETYATKAEECEESLAAALSSQSPDQLQQIHDLEQQLQEQSMELARLHEERKTQQQKSESTEVTSTELPSLKATHPESAVLANDQEDLRRRNRELLATVEQLTQEGETMGAENRSLRQTLQTFEEDMERVADQNAKLVGHVNHKQKIKYTMKLKEENMRLHDDNKRIRTEYRALEASKRGSLFEALPSLCKLSKTGLSQKRSSAPGTTNGKVQVAGQLQDHALEAVIQDFVHVRALIERAISEDDSPGGHNGDMSSLLERLRRVVASVHHARYASKSAAPSESAASEWEELQ